MTVNRITEAPKVEESPEGRELDTHPEVLEFGGAGGDGGGGGGGRGGWRRGMLVPTLEQA